MKHIYNIYLIYGENLEDINRVNLFDVPFINTTMSDAIKLVDNCVVNKQKKKVFYINADCYNKIVKDQKYARCFDDKTLVFPDGIGVRLACTINQSHLIENLNGTDMFNYLLDLANERKYSLFFLGAENSVINKLVKKIKLKYPGIIIKGYHSGFFSKNEESHILEEINIASPDMLFVAFGAPSQELWISKHYSSLNFNIAFGVGGLFDFYSGNKKRAPLWLRRFGLEWTYRLYIEPKRMWRRYLIGNIIFFFNFFKWFKTKS